MEGVDTGVAPSPEVGDRQTDGDDAVVGFPEVMTLARALDLDDADMVEPPGADHAEYWRAVDETLVMITEDAATVARAKVILAGMLEEFVERPWEGGQAVFEWPSSCDEDDLAYGAAGKSIAALARCRFDETRKRGLNAIGVAVIREVLEAAGMLAVMKADLDRLDYICAEGVAIEPADGFVFKTTKAKLRRRYASNLAHLNKGVVERVAKGEVIVLRGEFVDMLEDGMHMSAMHASPKDGDPNGRPIWDCGDMNSEQALAKGVAKYGSLTLPTVLDTVAKAVEASEYYAADVAAGDVMVAIQVDIKGAFQKIKVAPSSVSRTGLRLSDGRLMFHLTGFFGWCTFPIVWGVVTRVILAAAVARGVLFILGYVDDFTVFTTESRAEEALRQLLWVIETLLGPEAVNGSKTIFKVRKLVVQGWLVDFQGVAEQPFDEVSVGGTVAMSDKNLRKSLFQLLNLPALMAARRNVIESMISRGLRNSLVHRQLRPCVMCWAAAIRGLERDVVKELGPSGSAAVVLWRVFLCKNLLWPEQFGRTFGSFTERVPRVLVTFDACPLGIGIICAYINGYGETGTIFNITWVRFDKSRFRFAAKNDPSFQNTAEFLGAVMACLVLTRMGFRRTSFVLKGDSIVALTWACAYRAQDGRSQRSAMVFAGASLAAGVTPSRNFLKIPGDNNGVNDNFEADLISRGGDNGKHRPVTLTMRYPPDIFVTGHDEQWVHSALDAVDPEACLSSTQPLEFWSQAQRVIEEAMAQEGHLPEEIQADYGAFQFFMSYQEGTEWRVAGDGRSIWTLRLPWCATVADMLARVRQEYQWGPAVPIGLHLLRLGRSYSEDQGLLSCAQGGLVTGDALEIRYTLHPEASGSRRALRSGGSKRGSFGRSRQHVSHGVGQEVANADNGMLLAGPEFRGDVAGDGAPVANGRLLKEAAELVAGKAALFDRVFVCNTCEEVHERSATRCKKCDRSDRFWYHESNPAVAEARREARVVDMGTGPRSDEGAGHDPGSSSGAPGTGADEELSDLSEEEEFSLPDTQAKTNKRRQARAQTNQDARESDGDKDAPGVGRTKIQGKIPKALESQSSRTYGRCVKCKGRIGDTLWAAVQAGAKETRCQVRTCRIARKAWFELDPDQSPRVVSPLSAPVMRPVTASKKARKVEQAEEVRSAGGGTKRVSLEDVIDLANTSGKRTRVISSSSTLEAGQETSGQDKRPRQETKFFVGEGGPRVAPEMSTASVTTADILSQNGSKKKQTWDEKYADLAVKLERRVKAQLDAAGVYVARSNFGYKDKNGILHRLRYGLFAGADIPMRTEREKPWSYGEGLDRVDGVPVHDLSILTVVKGRVTEEKDRKSSSGWSASAVEGAGSEWGGAIIDSEEEAIHLRDLSSFINDPRNLFHWPSGEPVAGGPNVNVDYTVKGVLFVVAWRDLKAGEELIRQYGPGYQMLSPNKCPKLAVPIPPPPSFHRSPVPSESERLTAVDDHQEDSGSSTGAAVAVPASSSGSAGTEETMAVDASGVAVVTVAGAVMATVVATDAEDVGAAAGMVEATLTDGFVVAKVSDAAVATDVVRDMRVDIPDTGFGEEAVVPMAVFRTEFPTLSAVFRRSMMQGPAGAAVSAFLDVPIENIVIQTSLASAQEDSDAVAQIRNAMARDDREANLAACGVAQRSPSETRRRVNAPDMRAILANPGTWVRIPVFCCGNPVPPPQGERWYRMAITDPEKGVPHSWLNVPADMDLAVLKDLVIWSLSKPVSNSESESWHDGIAVEYITHKDDRRNMVTLEKIAAILAVHRSFGPGFSSDNAGDGPPSGEWVEAVNPGVPASGGAWVQVQVCVSGQSPAWALRPHFPGVWVRRDQDYGNVVETVIWHFSEDTPTGGRAHRGIRVERVNKEGRVDLMDMLSIDHLLVFMPETDTSLLRDPIASSQSQALTVFRGATTQCLGAGVLTDPTSLTMSSYQEDGTASSLVDVDAGIISPVVTQVVVPAATLATESAMICKSNGARASVGPAVMESVAAVTEVATNGRIDRGQEEVCDRPRANRIDNLFLVKRPVSSLTHSSIRAGRPVQRGVQVADMAVVAKPAGSEGQLSTKRLRTGEISATGVKRRPPIEQGVNLRERSLADKTVMARLDGAKEQLPVQRETVSVTGISRQISIEQEESLREGLSVTASTMNGYDKSFGIWKEFLQFIEIPDDPYLETIKKKRSRIQVIGLFIKYLGERKGFKKARIDNICSGVKKVFVQEVRNYKLWEHQSVLHWKKTFRKPARLRERARRKKGKRQPVSLAMLRHIRDEGVADGNDMTNPTNLKRRCVYLSCMTMYLSGARYCAIGATPKTVHKRTGITEPANKHSLTRADIEYVVDSSIFTLDGYRAYLLREQKAISREAVEATLVQLAICLDSDKVYDKKGRVEYFNTSNSDDPEKMAIRDFGIDLACWVLFESATPDSLLAQGVDSRQVSEEDSLVFSLRYTKARNNKPPLMYSWNVQRTDMTDAVKRAAVHSGAVAAGYSVYSLRHGSISNMANDGVPMSAIQEFCNHETGSKSTEGYITYTERKRPRLGFCSGLPSADRSPKVLGMEMTHMAEVNARTASAFMEDLSESFVTTAGVTQEESSDQSAGSRPKRKSKRKVERDDMSMATDGSETISTVMSVKKSKVIPTSSAMVTIEDDPILSSFDLEDRVPFSYFPSPDSEKISFPEMSVGRVKRVSKARVLMSL